MMHTNPVQSAPAAQNEAAAKAAPRQSQAAQASAVPQDKVTLSPQAQANIQQAGSADKNHDGDSK
jgi:hypothetical protein